MSGVGGGSDATWALWLGGQVNVARDTMMLEGTLSQYDRSWM
jgi:hypothetical protein